MNFKVRQTFAKRFRVSKKGKLIKRSCHQDHFNARDPGKKTRAKRRDFTMSKAFAGNIKKLI